MTLFTDKVMRRLREAFKASRMSLDELGQKMGYDSGKARRSAWQFLNKTIDPRLSMIEKAAKALDLAVSDLVSIEADDRGRRGEILHQILDLLSRSPSGLTNAEILARVSAKLDGRHAGDSLEIGAMLQWLLTEKEIQQGKDGRYIYIPGSGVKIEVLPN